MKAWKRWRRALGLEPAVFRLQYWAFRSAATAVRALGPEHGMRLLRGLGGLACSLDRRHRRIGEENLRAAYHDTLSPSGRRRIVRGVYRHFAGVIADLLFADRHFTLDTFDRIARFEGMDRIERALARGKGLILVGAHLGNWEIGGLAMTLLDYPLVSVARPQDNPLLDEYLNRVRRSQGQEILEKRGAVRGVLEALRSNKMLAVLIDQDARDEGMFVDFFGRPASTIPTAATLAIRTGAAVIPFNPYRLGDTYRYSIEFGEPIVADPAADRDSETRRILVEATRQIEVYVRRHPDQWLWIHRRWKTQPA
ncbi:MAG: lysophospholipid acyltransferase family protein [Planctomycetes bacterium]|nr:lysophospholipid acyltransferase family protein [Planctomycetota bacterium]